ncbi:MAG: fumarylacetoacetate hydrolase family protein, partial [Devosia sp.]
MKLATLRNGRPDGQLVVVSADLGRCVSAGRIAPNLQAALDNWETARPALEDLSAALESGGIAAQPFEAASAMAPLPRAYQRLVGAAYPAHAARLLAASGDRPPEPLQRPFLTQAASDRLLGPGDALALAEVEASLDFSAEIAVITGAVPQQPTRAEAAAAIRLVTIASEFTLRRRIAEDLRFGYGYLNSKPAVCLAPVAVTPPGLGRMWGAEKFTGTVRVLLN